jgi:hypothetical protein
MYTMEYVEIMYGNVLTCAKLALLFFSSGFQRKNSWHAFQKGRDHEEIPTLIF